jgi:hypothetical protein
MTAAVCHMEGDVAVLDALYEKRAPFNPSDAVGEIAALLRSYGISELCGDRYAAAWCTEGFARAGITYMPSERDKSQCFLDCQPLFTSGRIRLLDNERLTHQFVSLERRATRVGRDIVSHPDHRNAHDDLANSVSIAATLTAGREQPFFWDIRADIDRYFAEKAARAVLQ